jgi:hypothetical protein
MMPCIFDNSQVNFMQHKILTMSTFKVIKKFEKKWYSSSLMMIYSTITCYLDFFLHYVAIFWMKKRFNTYNPQINSMRTDDVYW